jgi:NifU-like protein involved in Fe-S cluster formation
LSYSEIFKDHIANPRNAGPLDSANVIMEQTNPVCGDRMKLYLEINAGRIERVGFLAYGCAPTLACGSALTELLSGRPIAEARELTRRNIIDSVGGLSSRKQHAAALALETLRSALAKIEASDGSPCSAS